MIGLVRDVLGGVDITKEDRAAAKRGGSGKEPAAVNTKWSNLFFPWCLISFSFVRSLESREREAWRLLKSLAQPGRAPSAAGVRQE